MHINMQYMSLMWFQLSFSVLEDQTSVFSVFFAWRHQILLSLWWNSLSLVLVGAERSNHAAVWISRTTSEEQCFEQDSNILNIERRWNTVWHGSWSVPSLPQPSSDSRCSAVHVNLQCGDSELSQSYWALGCTRRCFDRENLSRVWALLQLILATTPPSTPCTIQLWLFH